ncbi:hypothetical protein N9N67_06755 [Bacteriovoracaceae bacterium]|nr:hypothetical protein [Bacteriovoracaceae bacterium]
MKIKLLFILIFSFYSLSVQAAKDEKYAHVYVGAGELLGLGTVRVGFKEWEFGMLNQRAPLGAMKQIYKDDLYVGAGFVLNYNLSPGIIGAVGYEYYFWKIFSFRAEANVSHSVDNYSHANGLVGLTVYY